MGILTRNHVTVRGLEGAPVVMLAHGLGCDQRFWSALVERLESSFHLVLLDYVGSGNSAREAYDSRRYGSLDGYRDDLLEVRAALGLSRVHLVGHSVSSMIGMLAVLAEPEHFASLAMVAPSPRFLNDPASGYVGGFEEAEICEYLDVMDRNFVGWATAFSQLAAGPDESATRELFESFCSTDPRVIGTFARLTLRLDLRHRLPELRLPTLVVQCRRDPLAPLAVGEYLRGRIPGAEYAELDAGGHCPHVTHPDLLAASLGAFWRS